MSSRSVSQKSLTILALAALVLSSNCPAQAVIAEYGSYRDIIITPPRNLDAEARGEMRADAQEVADILKIRPYVDRIRAAKAQGAMTSSRAILNARMYCLLKLFLASEEVRKFESVINLEISRSNANLDYLNAKTNQTTNMINTFNFMQGGASGTVKQSLSLWHHSTQDQRQILAISSFSTSIAMSLVNLLIVPRLYSRKIDEEGNQLAYFIYDNQVPPDAQNSYVWKFITSPIPGSNDPLTRRQILVKHWEAFGGLNTKNETTVKKITETPDEQGLAERVNVIGRRMQLLHDLKSHIEEFDGALYELHNAIGVE